MENLLVVANTQRHAIFLSGAKAADMRHMPAYRFLNIYKTLRSLSTLKWNTTSIRHGFRSYHQFLEEFHSNVVVTVSASIGSGVSGREFNDGVEKSQNPSSFEGYNRVSGDVRESSRRKGKSRSTVDAGERCGRTDEHSGEIGKTRRCGTKSADRKTHITEDAVRSSWLPTAAKPIKLTDVYDQFDELYWRIPLPGIVGAEVERVLGGGLVPGSMVLLGGDPGVGKSTLLLQIAALIAEGDDADAPARVLYVSAEESVKQIRNRADRLCIKTEEIILYSNTDIEDILEEAHRLSPRALIIDSIQTVYLKGEKGSTGGRLQVRECTKALNRFAKETNISVFLIGHVTKTGGAAGPRNLEHIVDAVLYLEGEKSSSHRLLRPVKNRFGSTDELGVFKMSRSGFQGVSNPSEIFLGDHHSDSDFLVGLAVAVILDGSQAFVIEIQVIRNQAGLLLENGIVLNVVSGDCRKERGGDLAIAAATCSSFLEKPIPKGVAFIAEVSLDGRLRMVPQLEKRINTVAKLGYKKCIIPKSGEKSFSDLQLGVMEILECKNLKEMINIVFRRSSQRSLPLPTPIFLEVMA